MGGVLKKTPKGYANNLAKPKISLFLLPDLSSPLEKKRAVDLQKKELFQLFFLFLSVVFAAQSASPRLRSRHFWVPIALLSLSHLIFYVSLAQTLRCINAFKYQRRCYKLTLGLATHRLRQLKAADTVVADDFDIPYQEPPEAYFAKFKRNWALHFLFLLFTYALMVSSSLVMLCF